MSLHRVMCKRPQRQMGQVPLTEKLNHSFSLKLPIFIFSFYFDGVKGEMANLFFTTVPLMLILVINISYMFSHGTKFAKKNLVLRI